MIDDAELNSWFCREVLPLEGSLTHFIRRNLRDSASVGDARQEVYARVLAGVRKELPMNAKGYVYATARNYLIDITAQSKIVSIELVAELDDTRVPVDLFETERQLGARDELRRTFAALDTLPPRCREVVRLRKVEGLSIRETADQMGVGVDTVERQLRLGVRAIADRLLGGSGKIDRAAKAGGGTAAASMGEGDPT
ncbi:RNA polymerase sigma factor [Sphingopyxis fribergensis]